MNEQLLEVRKRLNEAKMQRGQLSKIAIACDLSYRTVYGVMCKEDAAPTVKTLDKLAAYFKKQARKEARA